MSDSSQNRSKTDKEKFDETPVAYGVKDEEAKVEHLPGYSPNGSMDESKPAGDYTHRKLKPRHIQLIGIGGTIGTALFVQIGQGLINGGPASLFMAFTIWYVFHSLNAESPF